MFKAVGCAFLFVSFASVAELHAQIPRKCEN